MASQISSNSQFFQWLRSATNRSLNTGANAAFRLSKGLHSGTTEYNKRKALRQLMGSSDEHLNDIGIKRADLKTALELPLTTSAGKWLERRRNRLPG